MDHVTLLEEMDRLLDAGEPLLTLFPKQHPDGGMPQLPDNISPNMRWYARHVAWRAEDREWYQHSRQKFSDNHLSKMVGKSKEGLLGWRAIGVLK